MLDELRHSYNCLHALKIQILMTLCDSPLATLQKAIQSMAQGSLKAEIKSGSDKSCLETRHRA